jgi:hypothetical protein
MAAYAKISLGPNTCTFTNLCLEATSVVGKAHGLSTTPEFMGITKIVMAANTSLAGPNSIYADATTLYVSNVGDKAVLVDGWAQHVHTLIR